MSPLIHKSQVPGVDVGRPNLRVEAVGQTGNSPCYFISQGQKSSMSIAQFLQRHTLWSDGSAPGIKVAHTFPSSSPTFSNRIDVPTATASTKKKARTPATTIADTCPGPPVRTVSLAGMLPPDDPPATPHHIQLPPSKNATRTRFSPHQPLCKKGLPHEINFNNSTNFLSQDDPV